MRFWMNINFHEKQAWRNLELLNQYMFFYTFFTRKDQ